MRDLPFSTTLLNELIEFGSIRKVLSGDRILKNKENSKLVPLILTGNLKVMKQDSEGREVLLYYLKSGESCVMSFLSSFNNQGSSIIGQAETDCEILFIPNDIFNDLIKSSSEWLDFVMKSYQHRFDEFLHVIDMLTAQKMDERLWNYLQTKCRLANSKDLIITHEEIANDLGTVREVISRLLKKFEGEGKLSLFRNRINLCD
jgi:CRP/FNR family transcriptional regulator, anaerobic regulatory protein